MLDFGFQAIISRPLIGYEKITKLLVDYEVPYIQLRMQENNIPEYETITKLVASIIYGSSSKYILHDNPALAKSVAASGVHLSRKGPGFKEARSILGPSAIIGLSCLNQEMLCTANDLNPDYIGIGPVFRVADNPDPMIGIAGLVKMLARTSLTAMAIGGITTDKLNTIKQTGVANITVIRELNDSPYPAEILKKIRKIYPW